MEKYNITRIVQCLKCPWKVKTNPHEIPDGYCEIKHESFSINKRKMPHPLLGSQRVQKLFTQPLKRGPFQIIGFNGKVFY